MMALVEIGIPLTSGSLIMNGIPIISHDKNANRGCKARFGTGAIDLGDEFVQVLRLSLHDFFQRFPNRRFEANAGPMARNNYVAKHQC